MASNPMQASDVAAAGQPRTNTCAWCGTVNDGTQLSCRSCGASIDVRATITQSGWSRVPGRKDMAKLQFGNSFCQIEGKYVPVADMSLAAEDSVYFAHHVLLWKDTQVTMGAMSLKGGWKRMLAGMPIVMAQAHGPGHIAFSRDAPGDMIALPIQPGHAVDVREHLFVVATSQVAYDWFNTNIWFTSRVTNGKGESENETFYPIGMLMDRFSASHTPGLLLLHSAGNAFVRDLAPNQTILIKPSALLFKDPTVQMQLHFERPGGIWNLWGSWSERYLWLRLRGPGRVAVQSVFERTEGESGRIVNSSGATEHQW
jgi:uncharacterized protein (AIM24 family)